MYSDNDFRLYHSYKGTTWKDHKYISKKNVNGNTRYLYNNSQSTEDPYARIAKGAEETSHVLNEAADAEREAGRRAEEAGEFGKARYFYRGANESQRSANRVYQSSTPYRVKANLQASEGQHEQPQSSDKSSTQSSPSISRFESTVNSLGDYLKKIRISW